MAFTFGKVTAGRVDYYTEQVATERHDYYAGHGEAPGVWTGKFAEQLGVSGQVDPEAFRAVLTGRHPDTGEKLKRWPNKVLAFDGVFAPPKSVSALWAIGTPQVRQAIAQAQAAAVHAALGYLAEHACVARLGRQGVNAQPGTGFAIATFTHRTSREADPQLHTHAVISNLAETADGRRAALDGSLLYRHAEATDAVFKAALRAELSRLLGLGWVLRGEQWEIEGMPAGLCRRWSTRSTQIDGLMAEQGLSGGRAAQQAAYATRKAKADTAPHGEDLHARFQQEARNAGYLPEQILTATLHRLHPSLGPLGHEAPEAKPLVTGGERGSLSARTALGEAEEAVIAELVGPNGLTEKASSFGRRDVINHAARILPSFNQLPVATAGEARQLLEAIADRVLRDPRVIPLLDPAARTSGEVIRPRDPNGRILREVCTHTERRYSTVDLLAAEHELLQRAHARQSARVAVVSEEQVEAVLAAHPGLDDDQQTMVRRLASSGAGVDVVVGKAGTGKTTALRCYGEVARRAGVPMVGVAPSATAAHQLATKAGTDACTLDKLLVEVAHGHRHLPPGVVVIVDEAAMVDTRNRLALQRLVDDAGGKVVDVGDHRQIPSVDVGGIHHVLATKLGAVTLGVNHRFRNPGYRDAADLIRDGHADKGIEQLRALGAVHEYDQPAEAWAAMVGDWAALRTDGADVRMFATERSVVDRLNLLARDHLVQTGEVAKRGRDYVADDDARAICLAVGDRVRLGRNDSRLPQPDGTTVTVRNGMTGTITRTARRHVVVELDPDHRNPDGPAQVVLPGSYAGADVDYGYASTADKAQAADVDDSLFAPSPATSAERAYVALSRGRLSNRIYAVVDSGWEEAIATSRAHTLANHQQPDWARPQDEELQPEAGRQPLIPARHRTARRPGVEEVLQRRSHAHETRTRPGAREPLHPHVESDREPLNAFPQDTTPSPEHPGVKRPPAPERPGIDLAL